MNRADQRLGCILELNHCGGTSESETARQSCCGRDGNNIFMGACNYTYVCVGIDGRPRTRCPPRGHLHNKDVGSGVPPPKTLADIAPPTPIC